MKSDSTLLKIYCLDQCLSIKGQYEIQTEVLVPTVSLI